jgi:hypothetical protein
MKAYQVKIGKRGDNTATLFIVEAEDYRYAIVRASEKFAEMSGTKAEECAVFDVRVIEEVGQRVNVLTKEQIDEIVNSEVKNEN